MKCARKSGKLRQIISDEQRYEEMFLPHFTVLEETKKLFFEILTAANVASKDFFDSLRIDFSRIEGLQGLTIGERKQFYSEYQTFAAKREREELRVKKQQAREEFRTLLEHWGEGGELDPDITFRQLSSVCCKIEFWSLLELNELEEIFEDFMSSYESSSRHLIKEKRHERMRELFKLFEQRWGSSTTLPTWSDACVFFQQNVSSLSGLDDLDRFSVFEDFVMEKVEKKKEDRRRQERRDGRKRREAFVALLEKYRDRIAPSETDPIRWDDFQPLIRDHDAYTNLIGTKNSSQPYDLFSEIRTLWNEVPRKRSHSQSSRDSDRKRLK